MRKLFLNGEEYELKSGDLMVIDFGNVTLFNFSAVTKTSHERLRNRPDGDDKFLLNIKFLSAERNALANFVCEIIGFKFAEECNKANNKVFYRLYK